MSEKLRYYILIILSALLMSLSFHPIKLHFLAWFGLVPLFFAIDNKGPGATFRAGLEFGFLFSLFSLFWIFFLQIEMNIKILMTFGLSLLFLYIGLYYAVSLLIANRYGLWVLPFAIAGLEFLRGIGELGFPWLSLGYSQAQYPLIIQQASIYGVYGISAWLVFLNILIFLFVKKQNPIRLMLIITVFFIPVIFGVLRIKSVEGKTFYCGIVQPDIDPNLKFNRALREKTFEILSNLSIKCAEDARAKYGQSVNLIIWPETATPTFLKSPGRYHNLVRSLCAKLNTPILTGTAIYDHKTHHIYNGAILVQPDGSMKQEYRKIHLVPFGEHIPFDHYIKVLQKIDLGQGNYAPGRKYTVFNISGLSFSCLICFESIFPALSHIFIKKGARCLINITNDGWFGKISGPQQHKDMAILRSVENGVYLLRSANTGISMVVDFYGRVVAQTELFKPDIIVQPFMTEHLGTIYQNIGYLLPLTFLILIAAIIFIDILINFGIIIFKYGKH